jgi:hypothetical protein
LGRSSEKFHGVTSRSKLLTDERKRSSLSNSDKSIVNARLEWF